MKAPPAELENTARLDGRPVTSAVLLPVTPLGAFATSALLVAVLALAFTLGRRYQADASPPQTTQPDAFDSLEQALARPALSYEQLPVDRLNP